MSKSELWQVYNSLCLMTVLQGVQEDRLFGFFEEYMKSPSGSPEELRAYASFVKEIYERGGRLPDCIKKTLFEDENIYVKKISRGEKPGELLETALKNDLRAISAFASLLPCDFSFGENFQADLLHIPAFEGSKTELFPEYSERVCHVERYGYGIFASDGMFRLGEDGRIEPVKSADKTDMNRFVGYEEQRKKVFDAAGKFVEGITNTNVLLTGDAGTGKSSTVKAVANYYFDQGLRLIEVRKDQLKKLPCVMDQICENPLKFIIFIDDLSFSGETDELGMLKAILEGSASARAENTVIYATSNRHHIVKESFSDRAGDDIHQNDTMQEIISLSERFGLSVYYGKPDKKLYLEIVHRLAERKGILEDLSTLDIKAEAFALRKGNRSPRCAEQFVDSLL